MSWQIVIPTTNRPSLEALLSRLAEVGVGRERVRRVTDADRRGPAAARNRGWRAARTEWVVFLDDDVLPASDWRDRLEEDLAAADPSVAGIQGRIQVPLPRFRAPTDWERNVRGLETARWATADMAYRREALAQVGGFDERFPRAFREDADLAIRIRAAGYSIVQGRRTSLHPVPPAGRWISLALQRGNADDVLMRALHGARWHERAGAPRGRRRRHLLAAAAAMTAFAAGLAGKKRLALLAGAGWFAGMVELVYARLRPGPGTRDETLTVVATSLFMPFAASYHWLAGWARLPRLLRSPAPGRPDAVLFDRDGTLVLDVPYNGDPKRVVPVPGARTALARLRSAGVRLGVVSNQSGVARGFVSEKQVAAVNRRVEELLGPLDYWAVCLHHPDEACACRKPEPGLVFAAARALGTRPERCAVVGDIGPDVEAALAAGARAILVPTEKTRPEEVAVAPEVAPDLRGAVDLILGARP